MSSELTRLIIPTLYICSDYGGRHPPLRPRPPHTPPPPRTILATDLHDKACSSPQIKLSRYGHEKETARHSALYPTISNALRVLLTLSTLTLTLRRSKTCFSKSKYIILLCFIDRTNQYDIKFVALFRIFLLVHR